VIATVGREQQRHGQAVRGRPVGQTVPPEQHLAQKPPHRTAARLARGVDAPATRLEVRAQELELRGGARAVDPFEDDEHG
jgi:hypothetical protein